MTLTTNTGINVAVFLQKEEFFAADVAVGAVVGTKLIKPRTINAFI